MERSSGPSNWMWLVCVTFAVFLVLALTRGALLAALGWLCLLVNGALVASGLYTRSRALLYLAFAFTIGGVLLLLTSVARDFFW
jgi:hypothetical protein